jgi:hypothetical protein
MTVIITEKGKNAQKLDKQDFTDEKELQEYIYENPETLPMYEIDEDIRVLILMREFPTNSGSIDALGVDANGNIYIVETKLYKNPDKRLVVAQALDYGAAIWAYYNDFSDFLTKVDVGANKKFGMGMNQKIKEFFQFEDDTLVEDLLENVKQNLNKGIFRFVVLMDHLEDRLKDLILFINKNSQFDVFAVELEYYKFKDHELMIPKLFGNEIKKDIDVASARSSIRNSWNEQRFLQELQESVTKEQFESIKGFYSFTKDLCDLFSWGSGKRGAFSIGMSKLYPKSILTVKTDGTLVFNLGWHKDDDGKLIPSINDLVEKLRKMGFFIEEGEIKQHYFFNIDDWLPKLASLKDLIKDLL